MKNAITLQAKQLACIRQRQIIFSPLSFNVNAGELLLIEGANGAGKSSLLRLLTGLITPAHGDILWCGQSIHANALLYRENLHYLSHSNGIKLGLTVAENLQLAGHLHNSNANSYDAVLSALQINAQQQIQAQYLSAGQKRRIALAKLLLMPKSIWLLDEPLTALDAQTQAFFIIQLTQHLQQGGIAVISSHHAMALPALNIQRLILPC
jgi:heme exporter protein A